MYIVVCYVVRRWMLLSFKREFSVEDGLKCFEVLSCGHLDLSSPEAEYATRKEQSKEFQQRGTFYTKSYLFCMSFHFLPFTFSNAISALECASVQINLLETSRI